MVSKSVNLSPLLAALTAAGVPVNLQVESQANPNLLVGVKQGANQAQVTSLGFLKVALGAGSTVNLQAADTNTGALTNLNAISQGVNLETLEVTPYGTLGFQFAQDSPSGELQTVQHVGTTGIDPRKKVIGGIQKGLNAFSQHQIGLATVTVTAATAWVSSIAISVTALIAGGTITVQDKAATPKKLLNALSAAAVTTTPFQYNPPDPVVMTGGIDIVISANSTQDLWVDYWQ